MSDYLNRLRASLPQRTPQCPRCGGEVRVREDGSDGLCLGCELRAALKGCSADELAAFSARIQKHGAKQ
jgi:hypothetical protein